MTRPCIDASRLSHRAFAEKYSQSRCARSLHWSPPSLSGSPREASRSLRVDGARPPLLTRKVATVPNTTLRLAKHALAFGLAALSSVACASTTDAAEDSATNALHGDCDASDTAGQLVQHAQRGTLFNAHLTWRQTNDAGQGIGQSCNLATHQVTTHGMADVPLHCSGKSQSQSGYARVGARWGTSRGSQSCTQDFCAAIYIQDGSGLREVVRDIYLKDRFYCTQSSDRTDERLDVDACTYADVVRALKPGTRGDDQSNLKFVNGHLAGHSVQNLTLKYKMYPCGGGTLGGVAPPAAEPPAADPAPWDWPGADPGPGACDDKPTPEGYTCAQQRDWNKCEVDWMVNGGFCRATCGHC